MEVEKSVIKHFVNILMAARRRNWLMTEKQRNQPWAETNESTAV